MTLRYHTPLSPAEQLAFGMDRPQPLAMADKVRFAELDVQNHVNNKAYMTWFESLRVAYSDLFAASHYGDAVAHPRTVMRSGEIRFHEEMLMGEDYVTTAGVSAFRNTSWTIHQELWSGGRLRASFDCIFVNLYPDGSGRRYPIPETLRTYYREVEGAADHSGAAEPARV